MSKYKTLEELNWTKESITEYNLSTNDDSVYLHFEKDGDVWIVINDEGFFFKKEELKAIELKMIELGVKDDV